jgi:predicted P-loop ATPase
MMDSFDREIENEVAGVAKASILRSVIHKLNTDDQLKGAFCLNLFTHDIEHAQDNIILSPYAKKFTPVTDYDASCVRSYLAKKFNMSVGKSNVDDAIIDCAFNAQYHPIKDYLESLKWDGIPRLEMWLIDICGAVDNAYTRAVGRKLLVAAVKRVYEPGCYYAQLVILEGRQRIFKSRLVKEIGKDWYSSIHLKVNDVKTIVEEMRGKWILEIEELAGFGKQETEYMKAFISRQSDRVRVAFGHRAEDFPRQSIMIATMNPDLGENKYLVDQTGNVRYWPVTCADDRKIKIDVFIDSRDQLFAEALVLYRNGENIWLDDDAAEIIAEIEQEKRLSTDPWGPVIVKWLETKKIEIGIELTTEQIAKDLLCIPLERINSGATRRIGKAMSMAGWIRKRKSNHPREWYYVPPEEKTEIEWTGE